MKHSYQTPALIIFILLLAGVLYYLANMRDERTTAERVGDAIHDLPKGLDKATDQLKDRTPAEKIGDSLKDAGDEVKKNGSSN